jgi:hypothetical protein
MGIPEEDLGPRWLRDYGLTDFGEIAADIDAMEEFAAKLAGDVRNNYATHLPQVTESMLTALPHPSADFRELVEFMTTHRDAQDATQLNVYNHANGTHQMASAAQQISANYRGADAFARARVSDVDRAFTEVSTVDIAPVEPNGPAPIRDH